LEEVTAPKQTSMQVHKKHEKIRKHDATKQQNNSLITTPSKKWKLKNCLKGGQE
jgi:hypothetical protein